MSDWEDFTEAHGYSANDPDALDNMMQDWEEDEKMYQINNEYIKGIKSCIHDKKNRHRINKFGFNNFKPFGEKLQSYSNKPITLIYGPNSIGKSSFIHLNAYMHYIFETRSFDLLNTDMFGDNINLGGFDKFIHKRDKSNSITLEFEFEDCSNGILNYLPKSKHINDNRLNTLALFNKDDIINIINDSEDYIQPVFEEANIEENIDISGSYKIKSDFEKLMNRKLFGYGSGIDLKTIQHNNLEIIYSDEEDEFIEKEKRKKEKLLKDRISNKNCNLIYKKEFDFLLKKGINRIDILSEVDNKKYENPFSNGLSKNDELKKENMNIHSKNKEFYELLGVYIYSGYYKESSSGTPLLPIKDFIFHSFINDNAAFINNDTEKQFISDILIPLYINKEKIIYIMNYKLEELYNLENEWDEVELTKKDIEIIAKNTTERISTERNEFEYYELLRNTSIPLKITIEFKYSTELKKIYLKNTNYYIQGVLFDNIEERIDKYDDTNEYFLEKLGGSIDIDEGEIITFSSCPPILGQIPNSINNIYYEYDNERPNKEKKINQLHDRNNHAIFLSYCKGYKNLIGAFNDMIYFNKLQYIGPLRFYPERDSEIKELDSNEEKIYNSKTSWSLLKKDQKLRKKINNWLKDPKKLKTPYEIKYRKLYDLNSQRFIELQEKIWKTIENQNKDIKKYNIHPDISKQDIHKLMDEMFEPTAFYNREGEQYIKDLIIFSTLTGEEKFSKILNSQETIDSWSSLETKEEMIFEDLRTNTQISNRDLGLGISQVLPVLIATNRNKNMTMAVEQPELHLHPAVQAELADEFIRSYKEDKNEFLIETHSEHLLLRIMKRMRYTAENKADRDKTLDLTPEDVCILYVDADDDSTYIKELRLSKKGKLLDHWPGGFFEEGFKERFS